MRPLKYCRTSDCGCFSKIGRWGLLPCCTTPMLSHPTVSLKGWYKAATDCAPKVSKMSLATQTAKRVALYGRGASKGDTIPIHVDKADILDNIPSDSKLRDCVRALWNGLAAGATELQAEHIKVWLANAVHEEEEEGDIGLGYK
jgi:hypothetical protein